MGAKQSVYSAEDAKAAVKSLESGCTGDEACALWAKYDKDGDGNLDKAEAGKIVADVIDLKINALKSEIAKLEAAKTNSELISNLLSAMDSDGDGTVTKNEFLCSAMRGYVMSSEEVEPQAKKAKSAAKA